LKIILNKALSKLESGFKYAYLLIFFALLAGFFSPIITETSFLPVISGVVVLFVGLAGGILVYKSATFEKIRIIYFVIGFSLISISLGLVFQLTGRV
jgi:uncharacterized membrane protein YjjP (DUF1212 family)